MPLRYTIADFLRLIEGEELFLMRQEQLSAAQTYYAQVNLIFTGASNATPEPPWEYRSDLELHEDA